VAAHTIGKLKRVPSETMRRFEAGPEGLEHLAFGAPNVGSGDAEIVQD
jgi:hypothetical protein